MNRVRAALLRLSPPWRRRHPVALATITWPTPSTWSGGVTYTGPVTFVQGPTYILRTADGGKTWTAVDAAYAAERDPSDEAGA